MSIQLAQKPTIEVKRQIQAETAREIQMRAKRILDTELSTFTAKHGPCPPGLLRELHAMAIFAVVFAWPDRPSSLFPLHPNFENVRRAFDQWAGDGAHGG